MKNAILAWFKNALTHKDKERRESEPTNIRQSVSCLQKETRIYITPILGTVQFLRRWFGGAGDNLEPFGGDSRVWITCTGASGGEQTRAKRCVGQAAVGFDSIADAVERIETVRGFVKSTEQRFQLRPCSGGLSTFSRQGCGHQK